MWRVWVTMGTMAPIASDSIGKESFTDNEKDQVSNFSSSLHSNPTAADYQCSHFCHFHGDLSGSMCSLHKVVTEWNNWFRSQEIVRKKSRTVAANSSRSTAPSLTANFATNSMASAPKAAFCRENLFKKASSPDGVLKCFCKVKVKYKDSK